MKNLKLYFFSGLIGLITLFMSCTSTKNGSSFASRKYFNFKHNNPVIVLNTAANTGRRDVPKVYSLNTISSSTINQTKSDYNKVALANIPHHSTINSSCQDYPKDISVSVNGTKNISDPVSEDQVSNSPAFTEAVSASSHEGGGSSVDQVILIILAILISPLAVYLYDNAATTRFWIDLILWVVGIGFFALFFLSGIAWLAAVIYAILIVTGSV